MAVSKDSVICPYCKNENKKRVMIGSSGLVNYCGTERAIICDKCGKEFNCEMIVELKFKTSKV